MNTTDNNDIKIADYLDNKMTAAEEAAFMQELSDDEVLRKQYEEELLLRALLSNKDAKQEEDDLLLQPADEHIDMIATALQQNNKAVVPMFRRYAAVAAVLLLVIGSAIIIWLMTGRNVTPVANNTNDTIQLKDSTGKKDSLGLPQQAPPTVPITKNGSNKDSLATVQSQQTPHQQVPAPQNNARPDSVGNPTNFAVAANINSDSLFAALRTPYSVNEQHDPPELEQVYTNLLNGNVSKVVAANEADFQLMGADDRNETVKQYLHLYKGIAYLAQNKSSNAIGELNTVVSTAGKNTPQYAAAQWYSALAWLKQKELSKAAAIAQDIAQGNSIYKYNAAQLLKAVSSSGK